MAKLEILEFPDPRLRTVAKPVEKVDDELRKLIDDMIETMYDASGIGLAATQVNVHKRLLVMDLSEERNEPKVYINPQTGKPFKAAEIRKLQKKQEKDPAGKHWPPVDTVKSRRLRKVHCEARSGFLVPFASEVASAPRSSDRRSGLPTSPPNATTRQSFRRGAQEEGAGYLRPSPGGRLECVRV